MGTCIKCGTWITRSSGSMCFSCSEILEITADRDYWKSRCEAAEKALWESIHTKFSNKHYKIWQLLVKESEERRDDKE